MNTQPTFTRATGQTGVVLIVALIMLVIIGLASVSIMRTAMNTDVIGDNTRLHAQAMQAAQAALQYCESQIQQGLMTPAPAAAAGGQEVWQTIANWMPGGTNASTPVPTTFNTNTAIARPATLLPPQCMAQYRAAVAGSTGQWVVATARGFSDNFQQDTLGHTQAGSVVWLQSIFQTN